MSATFDNGGYIEDHAQRYPIHIFSRTAYLTVSIHNATYRIEASVCPKRKTYKLGSSFIIIVFKGLRIQELSPNAPW